MDPDQLMGVIRETFPDGVPDRFRERLRDMAGPLIADLTAGGRLPDRADFERLETRWVGFTPNNSFLIDLMDDVQDRLGGPLHVQLKGTAT